MKIKKVTKVSGYKKLACKYCGSICERVDANATAITCSRCVSKLVNGDVLEPLATDKKSKKSKK